MWGEWYRCDACFPSFTVQPVKLLLEGRMSDVFPLSRISGLSFDSTLPSAFLLFCQILLLFLFYLFFCLLAHSPDFYPKNSSIFLVKR